MLSLTLEKPELTEGELNVICNISAEYLTLNELLDYAQFGSHLEFFSFVNRIIENYLERLNKTKVYIIGNPTDAPYLILTKTLQEQQKEIAALKTNLLIKSSQHVELLDIELKFSTEPNSIQPLITADTLLYSINMLFVIPRLKDRAKILNLNCLGLTRLPDDLISELSLSKVEVVHLSNNKLRTLSPLLGDLFSLTELDVSENQLSFLPEAIATLKALVILNVSNNKLTALPEGITELSSLKMLLADNNELTTLPDLGNLKSLKKLYLDYNRLSTLPDTLSNCKITHLSISNNLFITLPEVIGDMWFLYILNIRNNPLGMIAVRLRYILDITSNKQYFCSSSSSSSSSSQSNEIKEPATETSSLLSLPQTVPDQKINHPPLRERQPDWIIAFKRFRLSKKPTSTPMKSKTCPRKGNRKK